MGYGVRGSAEATETGQLMGLGERWGSGEVGPGSRDTRVARQATREVGGQMDGVQLLAKGQAGQGNSGH
jgi:hypothetical protein